MGLCFFGRGNEETKNLWKFPPHYTHLQSHGFFRFFLRKGLGVFDRGNEEKSGKFPLSICIFKIMFFVDFLESGYEFWSRKRRNKNFWKFPTSVYAPSKSCYLHTFFRKGVRGFCPRKRRNKIFWKFPPSVYALSKSCFLHNFLRNGLGVFGRGNEEKCYLDAPPPVHAPSKSCFVFRKGLGIFGLGKRP